MLIKNARIFTFDNLNTVIDNGYIKIEDGIIKKIGSMEELKENRDLTDIDSEIIDASHKIVMPGFICTHTHIYSAFARGMSLKGGSTSNFFEILENLWWRLDRKLNHKDIYYSAAATVSECIRSGVTCIFDHHAGAHSIEGSLDVIEKAMREFGMRGVLCYELSDRDGQEIADEGIKENVRFLKKAYNDKTDMVKGLFGLHASFTLSDETLEKASEEGNQLKAGFHVHVAEGKGDKDITVDKYKKGIVERLESFNIINDKTILAHCIHIDEKEKELLIRGNVVHNPESNMNNAVGYCDVPDLMKRGVLVGLGSDGFSANPFRTIDTCYVLHKHSKADPTVMTPDDVIKLAVKNNGIIASKFFSNMLGVIEKNAKADLIFIDYNSPTPVNKDNIGGHIIFGMNSNNVTDSIINGRHVLKEGKLANIDETELFSKCREQSRDFWKKF